MNKTRYREPVLLLSAALFLAGCGAMSDGRLRGDGATLTPGWPRVARAARKALLTPEVWAPAAAAVAIQAGGSDKRISSWASRKTPVFGSQSRAGKASHTLIGVSNAVYWASVLAAPGGGRAGNWIEAKAKLAAGGVAANTAAFQSALVLQSAVGRERPNHGGRNSFPSLHTAYAASQAMSAYTNFRAVRMTPAEAALTRGAMDAVPALTAWSRIEARAHYPSDTLAAMSLASFLSLFVSDAFLGEAPVRAETDGKSAALSLRLAF